MHDCPEQRERLSPYVECCCVHEVHIRRNGTVGVNITCTHYTATALQKKQLYNIDAARLARLHADLLADGWQVAEAQQGVATRTTNYRRARVIY